MKNKKSKMNKKEENKNNIPSFFNSNYFIYLILFLIMSISAYIRIVIPWNATFLNGITLIATDDAVYHMRLVENLIVNFPHRLWYDAFTNFPYGSVETWGSLYDIIIGTLALIFGVNNLNIIGALVPAIMGTLVIIPTYFIGAELLNKKAGLFGAFIIAILPGTFLNRSTLGFTDHHIAEVLFSTFFIMFLILAFNRESSKKYAILSGIFLGFYLLTWTTGILFAGIIAIFIIIQIFINYIKNKSNSSLITITTFMYGIPALMVLPFIELKNGFGVVYYSPTHIIALLSVILIIYYLNYVSIKAKENKYSIYKFVGISIISFIGILVLIQIILPSFFMNTFGSLNILFGEKTGGGLTIGEAQPTDSLTIYRIFGLNFLFAILGGGLLIASYFWVEKKEKILIVSIWCITMIILMFSQNRWSYYFAVNIAILSGLLCGYVLDNLGKFKDIKVINIWNVSSLIFIIFMVGFYPIGSSPFDISTHVTISGVKTDGFYEWYESMTWMRNNTPDTGLDYYGTYTRPTAGEKYSYPDTAYGVMSWWDYGHVITYWAHRIPNANPFQSGIGGNPNHTAGASTFLIAPTEEEANIVLDKLGINSKPGAKYIVSSAYMAYSIQPVFAEWDGTNVGYFQQLRTSQGTQILPSEKFYNTMESKLHIFDANGLKHYRLVHESIPNPSVNGGAQEIVYKQIYNGLINKNNPIIPENSGFVKIFEYVPGANIGGKTAPNIIVTINNTIITNIGRTIQYKQTTISDLRGNFNFTVPYSTTGSIPEGTQFDTKAINDYTISIGKNEGKILIGKASINENDILNGKTINI